MVRAAKAEGLPVTCEVTMAMIPSTRDVTARAEVEGCACFEFSMNSLSPWGRLPGIPLSGKMLGQPTSENISWQLRLEEKERAAPKDGPADKLYAA